MMPSLAKARLVYLQGWGEPFLNPDFFSMVALAKQAGCRVGATTNGMLLDGAKIGQLVDSGLDVLAFSLAGGTRTNDRFRRGAALGRVLETMEALRLAQEKAGRSRPAIHIAYLLLRSGIPDLAELPRLWAGLGVEEVVVSTLDFVPSQELESEAIRPQRGGKYEEVKARLDELAEAGRRGGIKVHYQLKEPGERVLLCPEKVHQALVVGADGQASPCAFLNLPVGPVTYCAQGQEQPYRRLTFGSLPDHSLAALWRQRAYTNFRNSFFTGKLLRPCQICAKMQPTSGSSFSLP
jgi:MoaA/NifB/PqqE/SkfB family radical SAM enzyme